MSDALRVAQGDLGVEPLADPERASAIVADLIAAPGAETAESVVALRGVLAALKDEGAGRRSRSVDATAVVDAAVANGASRKQARQVLDEVAPSLGVATSGRARQAPSKPILVSAVGAVAALAVASALWLWPGPDDPNGRSQEETPVTEQEDQEPAQEALFAAFEPVVEGEFQVERGWRITEGGREFIGIVRLSSPDGETAFGRHIEVPPPAAVTDASQISWTPAPTALLNSIGNYNAVELAGSELLEIEYRMPLELPEIITESDLIQWSQEWQGIQDDVGPPLGPTSRRLDPVVTSED